MTLSKPLTRCFPTAACRRVVAALALALASLTAAAPALAEDEFPGRAVADLSQQLRQRLVETGAVGYASYYARKFIGRLMADGTPMRADSDNAASMTLPLGSKALVTNLRNGRTAVVTIRDRGPHVKGRIIDLSPSTAKLLGMLQAGVARVAVVPLDDLPADEKRKAILAAANIGSLDLDFSEDGE